MFVEAVFPDRYRCAGLSLVPHTIGHALLLQRLDSPYAGRLRAIAVPGAAPQTGDLALALWVCTRGWRWAHRLLDTRFQRFWMTARAARIVRRGLSKSVTEMDAYLAAAWPEIAAWESRQTRTRAFGADLLHILIHHQRETGLSLEQALDVPLAIAHWDAAAAAERAGFVTLRSARDEALSSRYDRLMEAGALPKPGDVIKRN